MSGEKAHADMGPKPSITVRLKNPPEEYYYMDLLVEGKNTYSQETLDSWLNNPKDSEEDKKIKKILTGYSADGWVPWLKGSIVENAFHPQTGNHSYSFGYRVPDKFRVIIVTESGKIYVSNAIENQHFNLNCVYDVKTGKLRVDFGASLLMRVAQIVFCYMITIVIEGFLFLLFLLCSKNNLKVFLLTNAGTQIFLQSAMQVIYFLSDRGLKVEFTILLGLELIVLEIELFCYLKWLKKGEKKPHRAVVVIYTVLANLFSLLPRFLFAMYGY